MFRYLRIAILLTILLIVAGNQFLTGNRLNSWDKTLWVTVYPVLTDPDPDVRRYAEGLSASSFDDIGSFISAQASRYGREIGEPVFIQVARPLTEIPPALPVENSGLNVALWSLKWSWRHGRQAGLAPADLKMFVVYQKYLPDITLERSIGVRNAGYGLVNAMASRQKSAANRIVITHELLHILGASDKYDLSTGQPLAPDGLANPVRSPLYPQTHAEIMGGRIAMSASNWRRPASLKSCVIGERTAEEIGWIQKR
jgi:hypothetical protein